MNYAKKNYTKSMGLKNIRGTEPKFIWKHYKNMVQLKDFIDLVINLLKIVLKIKYNSMKKVFYLYENEYDHSIYY